MTRLLLPLARPFLIIAKRKRRQGAVSNTAPALLCLGSGCAPFFKPTLCKQLCAASILGSCQAKSTHTGIHTSPPSCLLFLGQGYKYLKSCLSQPRLFIHQAAGSVTTEGAIKCVSIAEIPGEENTSSWDANWMHVQRHPLI